MLNVPVREECNNLDKEKVWLLYNSLSSTGRGTVLDTINSRKITSSHCGGVTDTTTSMWIKQEVTHYGDLSCAVLRSSRQ